MKTHLKYKLATHANASTRTACEEDKNTEALSFPSHLFSVTSVFQIYQPKEITNMQLQNSSVELVSLLKAV